MKSNIKNLKVNRQGISLGMKLCSIGSMLAIVALLSGCGPKTMNCDVKNSHVHKYINKDDFVTYKNSELEVDENYTWTGEIRPLTKEDVMLDSLNLLSIEKNKDVLEKVMKENPPYTMYEFTYLDDVIVYYNCRILGPRFFPFEAHSKEDYAYRFNYYSIFDDDDTLRYCLHEPVYEKKPKTNWTLDPNHDDLTGRVREYSTKYYGYKIVNNSVDNRQIEKSMASDNIFDIASDYPYFRLEDYKKLEVIEYVRNKVLSK